MANAAEPVILSIDLGTSGPKVGLVTIRGEVLDCEYRPTRLILSPGGGAEQDPEDWWQAIKCAIAALLQRRPATAGDIVALSCTTQWSGTVPVDRDGNALMNAIIWMDSRGARYIDQIASGPLSVQGYSLPKLLRWIRLTGGVPGHAGKDPIAHILYIKNELPEIYRTAYKFLEPKDYLNMRLTGRFAASYDSICLHWLTDNRNIRRVEYDPGLVNISGLDREKLPDLLRSVDVLGPIRRERAAELGLSDNVQVVVGSPDIQSAAVGSGAVRDYEAHLYIGTSSWLACHLPFKKTDLLHNMAALPSAIPGRYLLTNEQEVAGMSLTYLADALFFPQDGLAPQARPPDFLETFNRLAESTPPGSGGLVFTPWLYGERTPIDDHLVRGGFFNQSLSTTRAHMIRAVFEGVAYNTRWLLEYVEKFIHRPLAWINMVGGGAISNLWCQIHADVLNRTVRQMKDPVQVNVRGAALLASVALGYLGFEQVAECVQVARTYQPDLQNRKIYAELSREFVNIYNRNRPIYARLNRAASDGKPG